MDWSNERYVRYYTRDTVTFTTWPWEAQALLGVLMRKLDRAGVLDIGDHDPVDAVWSQYPRWPREVIQKGLEALIGSGTILHEGDRLLMPNFLEAQEAKQSDSQRQRESRARRKDLAARESVTKRDDPVTPRDRLTVIRSEPSHDVTPCLTMPNHAVPTKTGTSSADAEPSPPAKRAARTVSRKRFSRKRRARKIHEEYENSRLHLLGGNASNFTDDHYRVMQQTVRYIQQERSCDEPEAWDWLEKYGQLALQEAASPKHPPEWADRLRRWRVGKNAWNKERYQKVMEQLYVNSQAHRGSQLKLKYDPETGEGYYLDQHGKRRFTDLEGNPPPPKEAP